MMGKLTELRKWIARLISPELALSEKRLLRLRSELSSDRHWLGYDFPAIDIYAFRALVMDYNYARKIDERPIPMTAGGTCWSSDISKFRDQLRAALTPENGGENHG